MSFTSSSGQGQDTAQGSFSWRNFIKAQVGSDLERSQGQSL